MLSYRKGCIGNCSFRQSSTAKAHVGYTFSNTHLSPSHADGSSFALVTSVTLPAVTKVSCMFVVAHTT